MKSNYQRRNPLNWINLLLAVGAWALLLGVVWALRGALFADWWPL